MKHKCKYCRWYNGYLEGSCNPRYDYKYNKYIGKSNSKEVGNIYPESNLKGECPYYKRDWDFILSITLFIGVIVGIIVLLMCFS